MQVLVEKNLISQQDILFGESVVNQIRGGGNFPVDSVRCLYPVNSLAELNALDPVKFPKAILITATGYSIYSSIASVWTEIFYNLVSNFAALATTPAATPGKIVQLIQYSSGNVGGGFFQDMPGTVSENFITTLNNTATPGRHWKKVFYDELTAYDAGFLCDGVTDDTLAAKRVLNAGLVVKMPDNKTSCISSRIDWSLPNSGFICSTEFHWKMLRNSFTQATYATVINTINCGFYASTISKVVFHRQHVYLEAGSGIRTCIAGAFSNCNDLDIINPRASGFQEAEFGVFAIDSCVGGTFLTPIVTDCTTADNTLATMQITGVEVDENRISNVYSTCTFGVIVAKRLTITGAALIKYGHQTDGITLSGGTSSAPSRGMQIFGVVTEDVDEPIDIQSANNYIGFVQAKNCVTGAKFVHAARGNRIDFVSAENTYSSAVVFVGSITAAENARGNSVGRVHAKGIGSLTSAWGSFTKAAVVFDGGTAIVKPNNNCVDSLSAYSCASMSYLVYAEAGVNNIVNDVFTETAPLVTYVSVVAPAQCQVNMREDTNVFVKLAADTLFTNGSTLILTTVVRDVLSEYNTTTGLFTAKTGGTYEISANIRAGTVLAAGAIGLRVNENGVEIAMAQQDNDSAGSKEKVCSLTKTVTLLANQTARVLFYGSASTTLTANTPFTNISIRKIK